jgi:dolichol kinase
MEIRMMIIVSIGFIVIFGLGEIFYYFDKGKNKGLTRKFTHITSGALIFFFPFIFNKNSSVLILSNIFFLILLFSMISSKLSSIHNIKENNVGAIIFPLIIYVMFVVDHNPAHFYQIPILVLCISDGFAGAIGKEWGKHYYRYLGWEKTLEGSLAFFVLTIGILITYAVKLPLNFFINPAISILLYALIMTIIEGFTPYGFDNYTVPFFAYWLLRLIIAK